MYILLCFLVYLCPSICFVPPATLYTLYKKLQRSMDLCYWSAWLALLVRYDCKSMHNRSQIMLKCTHTTGWPKKVSNYRESSLNRIKIFHQF